MPVGYQAKTTNTEKIDLVTIPGYWVEIVTCLERGALRDAEAKLMKANVQAGADGEAATSVDPDVAAYRDVMVQKSIIAWNIDGPDGQVIPITPENVDLLKGPDFDAIYDRVNALNEDMPPGEQKRFPGPSERGDHDGDGVGA